MVDISKLLNNLKSSDPTVKQAAITLAKNLSRSDYNQLLTAVRPLGGMAYLTQLIRGGENKPTLNAGWKDEALIKSRRDALNTALTTQTEYPNIYNGFGLITVVNTLQELQWAWILGRSLRKFSALPLQVWHWIDDPVIYRITNFTPVRAAEVVKLPHVPNSNKINFAIVNCPFEKVLYISPYTMLLSDPSGLADKDLCYWGNEPEWTGETRTKDREIVKTTYDIDMVPGAYEDVFLVSKRLFWRELICRDQFIKSQNILGLNDSLLLLHNKTGNTTEVSCFNNSAYFHETIIHYSKGKPTFQHSAMRPPKVLNPKGMEHSEERSLWEKEFQQLRSKRS